MKYFHLFTNVFILWMLDYVMTQTNNSSIVPEPKYHITPLGHYGLLIKCEIADEPKDAPYVAEYTITDAETRGEKERYFTIGDFLSKILFNLTPDTKYNIEARVKNFHLKKPIITLLEAKTNKRSAVAPFKPDFTYKIIPELYSYSKLTITWLPCGKQYNCEATPAGENFYVKYQEKGNNTDLLINRHKLVDEALITGCRPGKVYKFTVVSVYGQHETESEAQEITIPNAAPDLDFVEMLVDEDVVIPCKLPKSLKSKWIWNYSSLFRKIQDRAVQLEDGSLSIKKASLYHSGTYECSIPNSTPKTSVSTYLDVKEKTSIKNRNEFKQIAKKAGEAFEFPCTVEHDDSLTVFVDWLKNEEPIDGIADCEFQKEKNMLVISKPTYESSGNYTCVAKTRLDLVKATLVLRVV